MAATASGAATSSNGSTARSARLRIYEGASDVQKIVIARQILGGG